MNNSGQKSLTKCQKKKKKPQIISATIKKAKGKEVNLLTSCDGEPMSLQNLYSWLYTYVWEWGQMLFNILSHVI